MRLMVNLPIAMLSEAAWPPVAKYLWCIFEAFVIECLGGYWEIQMLSELLIPTCSPLHCPPWRITLSETAWALFNCACIDRKC